MVIQLNHVNIILIGISHDMCEVTMWKSDEIKKITMDGHKLINCSSQSKHKCLLFAQNG